MKTINKHIYIFVALYATPACLAFIAPLFGTKAVQRLALPEASTSRTRSAIYAKASNEKHSDNQGARTCVNNFLTQRSFQCFMFLLKEMHDPHTNSWIEDFLSSNSLLSYHGSGAFDLEQFPFWDSPFAELIKKEPDVVHVELKAKGQDRKSRNKNDAESKVSELKMVGLFKVNYPASLYYLDIMCSSGTFYSCMLSFESIGTQKSLPSSF